MLLIAIQYVVINHGAVRISEVTARFTLDALPGKQMAIDSDLNAGLIDEHEARQRRLDVGREAEFYGAMDGAVRFTQRDAIASILITAVNIVAGLLIGVFGHALSLRDALETYTVLTVGDGLVTIIPSLLISVSGGVITTRAAGEAKLGVDFAKQMFGRPEPLLIAAGALGVMAIVPGLPTIPFVALGGAVGALGWRLRSGETAELRQKQLAAPKPRASQEESVESLLRVEPLGLEVGLGLVRMVDSEQGGVLIRKIAGVRRTLASELGFVLPPVRVTDNLGLKANEYVVSLKGAEAARFELQQGAVLAIDPGSAQGRLDGAPTQEPAFGLPAIWIPAGEADRARLMGYTAVDAENIIATHLTELMRTFAHELFNRQDADGYLERAKERNPKLVEDLTPKLLPLSLVQRVLQNLLRERVSIRDAVTILEALAEAGGSTKNPTLLTEFVRQSMARALVQPYLNARGELPAYILGPELEKLVQSGIEHTELGSRVMLPPDAIARVIERIKATAGRLQGPTALLCGASTRFAVRQLIESELPLLATISHAEIPPMVRVLSLGTVS